MLIVMCWIHGFIFMWVWDSLLMAVTVLCIIWPVVYVQRRRDEGVRMLN